MQKQIAVVLIAILFIIVGLSGCNEYADDKGKIIGTWRGKGGGSLTVAYSFFSDGTCSWGSLAGTWDIKDGKIVMTLMNGEMSKSLNYKFTDDPDILYFNGNKFIRI